MEYRRYHKQYLGEYCRKLLGNCHQCEWLHRNGQQNGNGEQQSNGNCNRHEQHMLGSKHYPHRKRRRYLPLEHRRDICCDYYFNSGDLYGYCNKCQRLHGSGQ